MFERRAALALCAFIASAAVLYSHYSHLIKATPFPAPSGSHDPWSPQTIAATYRQYDQLADGETRRMSDAFDRLDSESRALGISVGYHLKLDALAQAEEANAKVTNAIADLAIREHGLNRSEVATGRTGTLFRAREALQHFVRDWSEEGSAERKVIATPILDVLRDERRAGQVQRVLVPGSGLGRLAWEISELGKLRLVPAARS